MAQYLRNSRQGDDILNDEQVETLRESVTRAQNEITAITTGLTRPSPTTRIGLQRVFRIAQGDRAEVDRVSQKYRNAAAVFHSELCAILPAPSHEYPSVVAQTEAGTSYRYAIEVGALFFTGPEPGSEWRRALSTCRRTRGDFEMWRAAKLIHEAVHWVNFGERRFGHCAEGELHDPYNYEFFVIEFYCRTPARGLIHVYHDEVCPGPVSRRPTGHIHVADSRGRFRAAKPLGYA